MTSTNHIKFSLAFRLLVCAATSTFAEGFVAVVTKLNGILARCAFAHQVRQNRATVACFRLFAPGACGGPCLNRGAIGPGYGIVTAR